MHRDTDSSPLEQSAKQTLGHWRESKQTRLPPGIAGVFILYLMCALLVVKDYPRTRIKPLVPPQERSTFCVQSTLYRHGSTTPRAYWCATTTRL